MNSDGAKPRRRRTYHFACRGKNHRRYVVAPGAKLEAVLGELESQFAARRHAAAPHRRAFLDTFDRRLAKKGLTLSALATEDHVRLVLEGAGEPPPRAVTTGLPAFATDLPAGPIRQRLEALIDSRRLLVLVKISGRTQAIDILDDLGKTIGRLTVERLAASGPDGKKTTGRMATALELETTRGFESAMDPVLNFIEARHGVSRTTSSVIDDALRAIGNSGDPPPSGKHYGLRADMRASEAARKILLHLLDVMAANESGVRDNLDPEFLHDFRVALRRMQSALAQIKDVFSPDRVRHFRTEFKWLRNLTNPVRDLDVQLLHIRQAFLNSGKFSQRELEPLLDHLSARVRIHRERMTAALDSDRYRTLVNEWRKFLETPAGRAAEGKNAGRDISGVAGECIECARTRVLRDARIITDETPAKKLHRLRIECKKLRYLLEFFSELFDPVPVKKLTRSLKRLQDHLGEFQDLQVQRDCLTRTAHEMGGQGDVPVDTVLVLGQMTRELELRQHELRKRLRRKFNRFRRNAERYRLNVRAGHDGQTGK